ncbi:MAG: cbb3-type cytochrome c oxidase N-terminal domain-containing protein [Flavobacteriales bacterium]
MSIETIFWMLMAVGTVQLLAIVTIGVAIRGLLKSEVFKQKLAKKTERENSDSASKVGSVALLLLSTAVPSMAFAGAEVDATAVESGITTISLYVALGANILLLMVIWYLKGLLNTFLNIDKTQVELEAKKKKKKKSKLNVLQLLTDAVPVEEEDTVATDHEYDGIRELDNNLPPWWKYGFYLSIVAGVIYFINFHVFKTGDLQIAEYEKDIKQAELDVNAYLKKQALNVDENSVQFMMGAKDVAQGKSLFMQYCKVCHGEGGQGGVGPNLTDAYWIHGPKAVDLFKTVKYGAANGMKSWKDELNPVQMQQVISFIKTLEGTNPDAAKEPQGDFYAQGSDSLATEGIEFPRDSADVQLQTND